MPPALPIIDAEVDGPLVPRAVAGTCQDSEQVLWLRGQRAEKELAWLIFNAALAAGASDAAATANKRRAGQQRSE